MIKSFIRYFFFLVALSSSNLLAMDYYDALKKLSKDIEEDNAKNVSIFFKNYPHAYDICDMYGDVNINLFESSYTIKVSAIHWACCCGSKKTLHYLLLKYPFRLQKRATVYPGLAKSITPLYVLVSNKAPKNSFEMAKILLDHGALVNEYIDDSTILHLATYNDCSLEMLSLLLNYGAQVNVIDNKGRTPIFYAKSREAAAFLISKKANLNVKDKYGEDPCTILFKKGLLTSGEVLKIYNSKPELSFDEYEEEIYSLVFNLSNIDNWSALKSEICSLEFNKALKVLNLLLISCHLMASVAKDSVIKHILSYEERGYYLLELIEKLCNHNDDKIEKFIPMLLRHGCGPAAKSYYDKNREPVTLGEILKAKGYEKSLDMMKKECSENYSYIYYDLFSNNF